MAKIGSDTEDTAAGLSGTEEQTAKETRQLRDDAESDPMDEPTESPTPATDDAGDRSDSVEDKQSAITGDDGSDSGDSDSTTDDTTTTSDRTDSSKPLSGGTETDTSTPDTQPSGGDTGGDGGDSRQRGGSDPFGGGADPPDTDGTDGSGSNDTTDDTPEPPPEPPEPSGPTEDDGQPGGKQPPEQNTPGDTDGADDTNQPPTPPENTATTKKEEKQQQPPTETFDPDTQEGPSPQGQGLEERGPSPHGRTNLRDDLSEEQLRTLQEEGFQALDKGAKQEVRSEVEAGGDRLDMPQDELQVVTVGSELLFFGADQDVEQGIRKAKAEQVENQVVDENTRPEDVAVLPVKTEEGVAYRPVLTNEAEAEQAAEQLRDRYNVGTESISAEGGEVVIRETEEMESSMELEGINQKLQEEYPDAKRVNIEKTGEDTYQYEVVTGEGETVTDTIATSEDAAAQLGGKRLTEKSIRRINAAKARRQANVKNTQADRINETLGKYKAAVKQQGSQVGERKTRPGGFTTQEYFLKRQVAKEASEETGLNVKPSDVTLERTDEGVQANIQDRERFGDIDWSMGLGGPEDEVERAVELTSKKFNEFRRDASRAVAGGGLGRALFGPIYGEEGDPVDRATAAQPEGDTRQTYAAFVRGTIFPVPEVAHTVMEGAETAAYAAGEVNAGRGGEVWTEAQKRGAAVGQQAYGYASENTGEVTAVVAGSFLGAGAVFTATRGTAVARPARYAIQPGEEAATDIATAVLSQSARGTRILNKIPGGRLDNEEIAIAAGRRAKRAFAESDLSGRIGRTASRARSRAREATPNVEVTTETRFEGQSPITVDNSVTQAVRSRIPSRPSVESPGQRVRDTAGRARSRAETAVRNTAVETNVRLFNLRRRARELRGESPRQAARNVANDVADEVRTKARSASKTAGFNAQAVEGRFRQAVTNVDVSTSPVRTAKTNVRNRLQATGESARAAAKSAEISAAARAYNARQSLRRNAELLFSEPEGGRPTTEAETDRPLMGEVKGTLLGLELSARSAGRRLRQAARPDPTTPEGGQRPQSLMGPAEGRMAAMRMRAMEASPVGPDLEPVSAVRRGIGEARRTRVRVSTEAETTGVRMADYDIEVSEAEATTESETPDIDEEAMDVATAEADGEVGRLTTMRRGKSESESETGRAVETTRAEFTMDAGRGRESMLFEGSETDATESPLIAEEQGPTVERSPIENELGAEANAADLAVEPVEELELSFEQELELELKQEVEQEMELELETELEAETELELLFESEMEFEREQEQEYEYEQEQEYEPIVPIEGEDEVEVAYEDRDRTSGRDPIGGSGGGKSDAVVNRLLDPLRGL